MINLAYQMNDATNKLNKNFIDTYNMIEAEYNNLYGDLIALKDEYNNFSTVSVTAMDNLFNGFKDSKEAGNQFKNDFMGLVNEIKNFESFEKLETSTIKMKESFNNIVSSVLGFKDTAVESYKSISDSYGLIKEKVGSITTKMVELGSNEKVSAIKDKLMEIGKTNLYNPIVQNVTKLKEKFKNSLGKIKEKLGELEKNNKFSGLQKGFQLIQNSSSRTIEYFNKVGVAYDDVKKNLSKVGPLHSINSIKNGIKTLEEPFNKSINAIGRTGRSVINVGNSFGNFMGSVNSLKNVTIENIGAVKQSFEGVQKSAADFKNSLTNFKAGNLDEFLNSSMNVITNFGNLQGNVSNMISTFNNAKSSIGNALGDVSGKYEKFKRTIGHSKNSFKKTFKVLGDSVGKVKGVFGKVGRAAKNDFGRIKNALKKSMPKISKIMPNFKGLKNTKMFGSISKGFSSMKSALTPLIASVGKFTIALLTCPITWIVVGIIALVMVIRDLWKGFTGGDSVLMPLIDKFLKFIGLNKNFKQIMQSVIDFVMTYLYPTFKNVFDIIVDTVMKWFNSVIGIFKNIWKFFSSFIDVIVGIFTGDKEKMSSGFKGMFSSFLEIITSIFDPFIAIIEGVINIAGVIFSKLYKLIAPYIEKPINFIINIFNSLKTYFVGIWDLIVGIFTGNGEKISSGIDGIFSGLIGYFSTIFEPIIGIFSWFIEFIGSIFSSIFDYIAPYLMPVIDFVMGIFGAIGEYFTNVFNFWIGVFTGNGTKVKEAFMGIFGKFMPIIKKVIGPIKSIFSKMKDFIMKPFESAFAWLSEKFKWVVGIAKKVGGFFSRIFGGDDDEEKEKKVEQKVYRNYNSQNYGQMGPRDGMIQQPSQIKREPLVEPVKAAAGASTKKIDISNLQFPINLPENFSGDPKELIEKVGPAVHEMIENIFKQSYSQVVPGGEDEE